MKPSQPRAARTGMPLEQLIPRVADLIGRIDPYTRGHSQRVAAYARLLAVHRQIEFPPDQLVCLRYGALLHDVGKTQVCPSILNKPTSLTPVERRVIEQHPLLGHRLIASLDPVVRDIVLYHHENYDGTGYPAGLTGDEIPLAARIVRIADVYEALTSHRPYRAAFGQTQALEIIGEKQTQFDPGVYTLLVEILSDGPRPVRTARIGLSRAEPVMPAFL